jgi:hypothetical protein
MHIWNWADLAADVIAFDGSYGLGVPWGGLTTMINPTTPFHATQMHVQINLSRTGTSYAMNKAMACHEFGHAVAGMLHDPNGCTRDPIDPNVRSPSWNELLHAQGLWGILH